MEDSNTLLLSLSQVAISVFIAHFDPQIQLLKTHSIAQSTVQVSSFMKELWGFPGNSLMPSYFVTIVCYRVGRRLPNNMYQMTEYNKYTKICVVLVTFA